MTPKGLFPGAPRSPFMNEDAVPFGLGAPASPGGSGPVLTTVGAAFGRGEDSSSVLSAGVLLEQHRGVHTPSGQTPPFCPWNPALWHQSEVEGRE